MMLILQEYLNSFVTKNAFEIKLQTLKRCSRNLNYDIHNLDTIF